MQTFSQGRVQFFETQSQYSSVSQLSSSRYINFVQQIIEQSATIRNTLRAQLTHQNTQQLKSKLKLIMNRAEILIHYTIPQHIRYVQRPNYQKNHQTQKYLSNQKLLKKCLAQVQQICQNYKKLTSNQIAYEQFYTLYTGIDKGSSSKQANFPVFSSTSSKFKKDGHSKFQDVQIIEPVKYMYNSFTNFSRVDSISSQYKTQNKWLIGQISELKQQILETKTSYQIKIQTLKLNYEKRLQNMIQSKFRHKESQNNNLMQQLKHAKQVSIAQITEKLALMNKNAELQFQIETLKRQNKNLRNQIQKIKQIYDSRIKLQQSRKISSSVHSKLQNQKKLRNDQSLVKLLKFQVQHERLKTQEVKDQFEKKVRSQLEKQKNKFRQLEKKLQQITFQNDSLREKNSYLQRQQLNLQQRIKDFNKQIVLMKQKASYQTKDVKLKTRSQEDRIIARTIKIQQYEGDGLEGFIHYQCLEKQFRYRFKRACLKQKELLYKKNGLQIGVITNTISKGSANFQSSCKFLFTIYLTNYSNRPIKEINAKAMNYFKIIGVQKFQFLKAGDQKKFIVQLQIQSYPIGPVLLCIKCASLQQIKVLLPANIFKLFKFQQNKQKKLMRPVQMKLINQRKIVKNLSCLKDLLNARSNSESLNLIGTHQHTKTTLLLNIQLQKQEIRIKYQHLSGSPKIVQYFIKCFCFLVKKIN